MTFWEHSNDLGKLEIFEVYEYYDRPVLLALRSVSGATYIAVLADSNKDADQWLCVAVSQLRLEAVRSGGVDLRTGFSLPEDGRVFVFRVPRDGQTPVAFKSAAPAEIANEWFPAPNAKLEIPTDTLPSFAGDLKTQAVQRRRDLLDLILDPVGTTRNEAPVSLVSKVLESVQATIAAFAQLADSELMLVRVGGGSFEMMLASADQVGTLNESAITNASKEFGQLVQLADDDDAFRVHAAALRPEVAAKFLSFLRAIENRATTTIVEWASPNSEQPSGRAVISNERVKSSITAMVDIHETKRFDVTGVLNSSNVEKGTFDFVPDEPYSGVDRFVGKASLEVLDPAHRNTPGLRFTATIEQRSINEAPPKYTLVRLVQLA
jgi:hypothetical protein